MKKSRAQDQAFATPEILEAILLQLPFVNLLVDAHLVNHEWKNLIDSSPLLQQALFFQPESFTGLEPRINSLLQRSFPIFFDRPQIGHDNVQYQKMREAYDFATLNWNSNSCRQKAYSRATASWRRMLPFQPPILTLEVTQITHGQRGDSERSGEKYFENGLRMGPLWDLVASEIARPISTFGIKWIGEKAPGAAIGLLGWRSENDDGSGKAVITLGWTVQCCCDIKGDLGKEFMSDGFEKLKITFGEEKPSLQPDFFLQLLS